MIFVEAALFGAVSIDAAETRARELRVLRELDTDPDLLPALAAAGRLDGDEAAFEIIRELDRKLC